MRIAVTYNNGMVFPHFGRTENFKLYEVEDNKVKSFSILNANGVGHEALAGLLAMNAVDVLICGGMGEGAQTALKEAGITVCAGAQGDADAAVQAYLRGELVDTGVNCDHHEHENEHAAGGCAGSCGGNCGGGCPGCGPHIEGPNVGMNVRVHYRGTFNDGTQFDSSYDRGETLNFVCGVGMMIPGFDKAVATMAVGESVDIHLMPEEAYGPRDTNQFIEVVMAQLPGSEALEIGQRVYLQDEGGQPFPVTVIDKDDKTITFDANHEMAGKELNFHIELIEVTPGDFL